MGILRISAALAALTERQSPRDSCLSGLACAGDGLKWTCATLHVPSAAPRYHQSARTWNAVSGSDPHRNRSLRHVSSSGNPTPKRGVLARVDRVTRRCAFSPRYKLYAPWHVDGSRPRPLSGIQHHVRLDLHQRLRAEQTRHHQECRRRWMVSKSFLVSAPDRLDIPPARDVKARSHDIL